MAIQFNCPYCTATMRVPDTESGKRGICPKCKTEFLVPRVEPPPQPDPPPSPTFAPPPAQPAPIQPTLAQAPVAEPVQSVGHAPAAPVNPGPAAAAPQIADANPVGNGFPPIAPNANPAAAKPDSMAKRLRRRRKSGKQRWVVPVTVGTVFVLILAVLFWPVEPKLEGKLLASIVINPELAPGLVRRSKVSGLSDDQVGEVLDGLARRPQVFKSHLIEVELRGTSAGIDVHVRPTSTTEFFRVDVAGNYRLRDFAAENDTALNAPRRKELTRAVNRFFPDWLEAEREQRPIADPMGYRNQLGLNALVRGLGYHVEAVIGHDVYRCVYEDGDGLYFLLPAGTKRFQLRGRQLADGSTFVPANFTVEVSNPIRDSSPPVKVVPPPEIAPLERPTDEENVMPQQL